MAAASEYGLGAEQIMTARISHVGFAWAKVPVEIGVNPQTVCRGPPFDHSKNWGRGSCFQELATRVRDDERTCVHIELPGCSGKQMAKQMSLKPKGRAMAERRQHD